jgi:hypothetical protein
LEDLAQCAVTLLRRIAELESKFGVTAQQGIYREFFSFLGPQAKFLAQLPREISRLRENSLLKITGNFLAITGNLFHVSGIFRS